MKTRDDVLLEQAYNSIRETAGAGSDGQHSDQEDYQDAPHGARTSTYKTVQPGMGKRDELSDPQMQEALAILNQYAQGDITNVEAAKMFKDLYEKGAGQGPTQDDMYYTKLK